MKRLVSLIAATALLATALAVPASARTGEACEEGTYSNTWLCATIKGPNVVTLSRTKSVNFELTVNYTASHAVEIDTNNYIRLTSQSTGSTWAFQLHSVGAKRDWVKLVAAPGLPTGRYTVDLHSSGYVYYGSGSTDYEWLYISQPNILEFEVKAAPKAKSAAKATMKLSRSKAKVAYGKKVTLKGSVVYGSAKKPLKGKKLTVYFNPAGERPKKKVGTVKTTSKGTFSKAFKQKVPGKWTVTWKGSSSVKKVSKSVSTKVKPTKYKNCKAVNKDYRGGVAKTAKAARKARVDYKPYVFKSLYTKNKKLDRDKDGVVCER